MSNEEFEKRFDNRMEFIIEQQAQFASNMQKMEERVSHVEDLLTRLAVATTAGFKQMNEKVSMIIDAQIRAEENVSSLTGNVSSLTGTVSSIAGTVSSLVGTVSSLIENVSSLTGNVSSLTENISVLKERMNELAEAQAHTDQRLNVIIDIISEGRDGQSRN